MKMKKHKKSIVTLIVLFSVFTLVAFSIDYIAKQEENKKRQMTSNQVTKIGQEKPIEEVQNNVESATVIVKEEEQPSSPIFPTEYKGWDVIAQLEIPKIKLKTYVLSEYSKKALLVSVTKFYGCEPNQVGNFCIAGHNYIRNNMFHNIKKLKVGDTFTLTDKSNQTITYQIYKIEKVKPSDTKCLSQNTKGRREVTLITCTYDSSMRIIVKAKESCI